MARGNSRNPSRALAELEAGTLTVSTLEAASTPTLPGQLLSCGPPSPTPIELPTSSSLGWSSWLRPKTDPSGKPKSYTWYQQNVHMVPWTWDEEVVLLHRELERAQLRFALKNTTTTNLRLNLHPSCCL